MRNLLIHATIPFAILVVLTLLSGCGSSGDGGGGAGGGNNGENRSGNQSGGGGGGRANSLPDGVGIKSRAIPQVIETKFEKNSFDSDQVHVTVRNTRHAGYVQVFITQNDRKWTKQAGYFDVGEQRIVTVTVPGFDRSSSYHTKADAY